MQTKPADVALSAVSRTSIGADRKQLVTSYPAVLRGRLCDKCVKFRDPCLNLSRQIPPEAVGGGIFEFFSLNFRLEADNDVFWCDCRVRRYGYPCKIL